MSRLRAIRVLRGLTQEQLAGMAGITPRTLYSFETGKTWDPGIRTLSRLAAVLHASLEAISEDDWLHPSRPPTAEELAEFDYGSDQDFIALPLDTPAGMELYWRGRRARAEDEERVVRVAVEAAAYQHIYGEDLGRAQARRKDRELIEQRLRRIRTPPGQELEPPQPV